MALVKAHEIEVGDNMLSGKVNEVEERLGQIHVVLGGNYDRPLVFQPQDEVVVF